MWNLLEFRIKVKGINPSRSAKKGEIKRALSAIVEDLFVWFFRLSNGGDYLFQANDNDEMVEWVNSINRNVQQDQAGHESSGAKSQTLPAGIQGKDEPKKRSFFTLKKK